MENIVFSKQLVLESLLIGKLFLLGKTFLQEFGVETETPGTQVPSNAKVLEERTGFLCIGRKRI